MASTGVRRTPGEFQDLKFLEYTTPEPDDEMNLGSAIHYKLTIEDGRVWIWTRGRRKGKTIYYGHEVQDLQAGWR